jgi:hypothetical protein
MTVAVGRGDQAGWRRWRLLRGVLRKGREPPKRLDGSVSFVDPYFFHLFSQQLLDF